jgi:hypothetical protein
VVVAASCLDILVAQIAVAAVEDGTVAPFPYVVEVEHAAAEELTRLGLVLGAQALLGTFAMMHGRYRRSISIYYTEYSAKKKKKKMQWRFTHL